MHAIKRFLTGQFRDQEDLGFHPAFLDTATFCIHRSQIAAKGTLISGFERNGFFYTRSAAARAAAEWRSPE